MEFIKLPKGDAVRRASIGGVRATDKGLMILGLKGGDDLVAFAHSSPKVAEAWLKALVDLLVDERADRSMPRRLRQPDWKAIAWAVDPEWAGGQYPGEAPPVGL